MINRIVRHKGAARSKRTRKALNFNRRSLQVQHKLAKTNNTYEKTQRHERTFRSDCSERFWSDRR